MSKKQIALKKLFNYEVEAEQIKYKQQKHGVFTAEDISTLPDPVQRYFNYCGYIGKEKMTGARFVFGDVSFRLNVGKPWIKIKYQQYNFVPEPARIVHIYTRMFGIIPFEGRDKYQDGQGNMIGRLLKKKTLFDVTGREIDISAAVTYLSEILVVPACALQEYIKWESIDDNHCKASINYRGVNAEGIFTFNEKGELTKFQTDDRYMYMDDGASQKHCWSGLLSDYIEMNGIKIPSRIKGVWNLEGGDHEYFDGRLVGVEYNSVSYLHD